MSQDNNLHCCVTYPCPVCSRTFPVVSPFVQPQLTLWSPDEPPGKNEPLEKTASNDDIEDLTNVVNEMEVNLERKIDIRPLVREAQEIVERIRNDRM